MAVKTKRCEQSVLNPDEYLYKIKIEEVDGTTVTKNAYGEDLEEALTRLQLIERKDSIVKFIDRVPEWVLYVAVFCVMGGAALLSDFYNTASWITGTMGIILLSGGALYFINRWIEKGRASSNNNNEDENWN